MAEILHIGISRKPPRLKTGVRSGQTVLPGEVVIFPGVRYARMGTIHNGEGPRVNPVSKELMIEPTQGQSVPI